MYKLYKEYKDKINGYERCGNEHNDEMKEIVDKWKELVEAFERQKEEYKVRYDRELRIKKSFTDEQIDFICYQIGEWYMDWKNVIANFDTREHRLGYAKEQLKKLICG